MSKKKIGAYITLDGEKEFRSAVSSCNKSLATMKSEMKLVEAQTAGSANSLETLQKKHDVLSRTLEEQIKKEDAVKDGLKNARQEYVRIGTELQEYKEKLQQATTTLSEMENSSDTTDEALKTQKETVADLNKIIEKGEETYKRAGSRVQDWQKQLNNAEAQTIRATKALNENDVYLKEAEKSFSNCAESIDEFGRETDNLEKKITSVGNIIKVKLTDAVIDAGTAMIGNAVQGALELQDASQKLAASTNATAEEMEKYSGTMENLYKNNYGDSIGEVADNIALVRQYTGEVDPTKLEELTENAMALDDTFSNMDISETLRGADVLMKNMGLSAEEAFDYITTGAQNGLNKSGELTDNIAEYGPLWAQAGFSAQEMFTILDNGLDSGAYNLDKVNDFVKEFGISLSDGRIKESIDSFSSGTQELFAQWENGEAPTKDVFYSVINDLQNMTNQQEALTLASNVWSSLGEDNAMNIITSLDDVNDTFLNVKGSMESLKEVRYDSVTNQYKQLGRTVQTDVIQPVLVKFLPAAQKGIKVLTDNIELAVPAVTALGAAFAVNKARKYYEELKETGKTLKELGSTMAKVVGIQTVKTAVDTAGTAAETANTAAVITNTTATTAQAAATGTATVAQHGLNAAMSANPAMLVIGGITALIGVLAVMKSNIQSVTDETDELCRETEELNDKVSEAADNLKDSYSGLEESIGSLNDKETAADNLVSELYKLESASNKSSGEIARMSMLADELNAMFPELSLSVDKATGSLNKNEAQTKQSINTYLRYSKVQAAQEKMAEIAEELTDADMARYEAEKNLEETAIELEKLEEERKELLKECAEVTEDGTKSGIAYAASLQGEETALGRNTAQMNRLKEAMKEQQIALEEMDSVYDTANQKYAEAYEYMENLTNATTGNTDAVVAGSDAKNEASKSSIEQMGQELEAYNNLSAVQQDLAVNVTNSVLTMQENVQSALESQMSLFEEFDAGTKISTENLLANMQSQVDGVTAWEENMAALMTQTKETTDGTMVAIDEGLMQYLASMGPEGASYVQAFVNMSGDELAKANGLWQEKMAIESFTNEAGVKLTNSIGSLSAGGTEAFDQLATDLNMSANEAGVYSVQGLVNGMEEAQKLAEAASKDLGVKVIDSLNEELGCHSPSTKTKESGKNTDQGLILGMKEDIGLVTKTGEAVGMAAINGLESCNMYDEAYKVGKNFASGMKEGILSTAKSVADQAAALVRSAIDAANKEQDAHSPANETKPVGRNFGAGVYVGIEEEIPNAEKVSEQMIDRMITAANERLAYASKNVSNLFDFSELEGKVSYEDSSLLNEMRVLSNDLINAIKTIRLVSYIGERQITRELSDLGVVFHA